MDSSFFSSSLFSISSSSISLDLTSLLSSSFSDEGVSSLAFAYWVSGSLASTFLEWCFDFLAFFGDLLCYLCFSDIFRWASFLAYSLFSSFNLFSFSFKDLSDSFTSSSGFFLESSDLVSDWRAYIFFSSSLFSASSGDKLESFDDFVLLKEVFSLLSSVSFVSSFDLGFFDVFYFWTVECCLLFFAAKCNFLIEFCKLVEESCSSKSSLSSISKMVLWILATAIIEELRSSRSLFSFTWSLIFFGQCGFNVSHTFSFLHSFDSS